MLPQWPGLPCIVPASVHLDTCAVTVPAHTCLRAPTLFASSASQCACEIMIIPSMALDENAHLQMLAR
eukprot:14238932-Alexandrium_andersonii.AAC.1